MQVREHESQHEAAEGLPLVTESAIVSSLTAMDTNRTEETIAAIDAILDEYGTPAYERAAPGDAESRRHWVRRELDAVDHVTEDGTLDRFLVDAAQDGDAGEALETLQARYLRPYPSLVRMDVTTEERVEFQPGQYLSIRFEEVTRPYSISSPKSMADLEFCIRRVPGGQLTPNLVDRVEEGTELTLRGPYGELLLQEPSTRDVVFLATGTGVAPFRPMIAYIFETGRDIIDDVERDVWLFLGAGWRDDLPYKEYFETMSDEHENFHFVPTLSRESLLSDWSGETEYVQYVLTKYLDADAVNADLGPAFEEALDTDPVTPVDTRLDPEEMDVYACGVTAMVNSLVDAVETLGVPEDRTEFEAFG